MHILLTCSAGNLRWAVAILLFLLESILWILFIGLPFGWGESFGRPICEPDEADHWIKPFQHTTHGGWKKDYDTFYLELLIIACHLIIAIAVPISLLFQRSDGRQGARTRTGAESGVAEGFTGVAVESLRTSWWFTALASGAVVIYVGQALAAFKLGYSWAEGVVQNRWNEVALGDMLYDHILALLYLTLVIGFSLASITARWILAGLSCTSATIFMIWALITVGGFIPLFFVSSYWIFWSFEDSKGQESCSDIFGDDGNMFGRAACDIRAGTYIAGIILLLISVAGPILIGLVDYARVICLPRRRAWVSMPTYWRSLVNPKNPDYRTFASANDGKSLVNRPLLTTGQGYHSATTEHFNWSKDSLCVSLTVPASQVELAPEV